MAARPAEGAGWKPRISGNNLAWDGEGVVKDFGLRFDACAREMACLSMLGGRLPVPRLLAGSGGGRLRMAYIDGDDPVRAIEAGGAGHLLLELGQFLRRLQEIEVGPPAAVLPGDGAVIVHGDFGPHNALIRGDGGELAAIVDWEEAHLGDPVTDLAWCEWQFRTFFERHTWALHKLFEGYGSTPAPELREAVVQTRLRELRDRGR
jgi:hypothetical protein